MEAKRNHLVNISTKNAAFKGKNDSEICHSPKGYLSKLSFRDKEAQQLASEKEKEDWKFNNC